MNLNRVDLNLLVALDALLTEQSVTLAAERLHIGQSAMSATLGRLRKLFNDPLLVKQGRRLAPTPFARSILPAVRDVLDRVDALLVAESAFHPDADHRDFSITANDYIAATFIRPLIATLATEAPNVRLHVRPAGHDFAEPLSRGETDLLIIPKDVFPGYADLPHTDLFSDRYVCAVDADNKDVGDTLTRADFEALPYLAVNFGTRPTSAELQLDALGVVRNTQAIIETFTLAPFMLGGTRLLTLIQERLALAVDPPSKLRLLEPPIPLRPITMVMIWNERDTIDPAHKWLRERACALAAELSAPHSADQPV
ncbi:LysR family transcriptional regulator [Streptomyces mirabilis]|uniref:LysR family transcriptional regulator n=1 Tax=Streptomyces mirabilis TaxID=68239 RepID=UPI0036CEF833